MIDMKKGDCKQRSDDEEFNLMLATVLDWTWLFTNR